MSASSQSRSTVSSGICFVCLSSFQLFGAPPQVRKHGHTKTKGPSLGSYRPPLSGASQPISLGGQGAVPDGFQGTCYQGSSQPDSDTCQGGLFNLPGIGGPVIPRIPKGARGVAAQELVKRLEDMTRSPNDVSGWRHLFDFAASFRQPVLSSLGKGKNLTTAILNQLRSCSSGGSIQRGLQSENQGGPGHISKLTVEEQ